MVLEGACSCGCQHFHLVSEDRSELPKPLDEKEIIRRDLHRWLDLNLELFGHALPAIAALRALRQRAGHGHGNLSFGLDFHRGRLSAEALYGGFWRDLVGGNFLGDILGAPTSSHGGAAFVVLFHAAAFGAVTMVRERATQSFVRFLVRP